VTNNEKNHGHMPASIAVVGGRKCPFRYYRYSDILLTVRPYNTLVCHCLLYQKSRI